eukprot:scaffold1498_cov93-Cylindrotheca_fusiformis.AAC.1
MECIEALTDDMRSPATSARGNRRLAIDWQQAFRRKIAYLTQKGCTLKALSRSMGDRYGQAK